MTVKFIKGQFMYKAEGIIFVKGPTETFDVPVLDINVYFVSSIMITKDGQVVIRP